MSKKYITKKKRIIILSVISLVVVVLIGAGLSAYRIFLDPSSLFTPSTISTTTAITSKDPAETLPDETPAPTEPTIEPIPDIVNILLIGLDCDENGEKKSGSMYHSDVMMVVAINFKAGTIDLISLPRDTMSHIPGVKGIYKLNASINVGGGIEAPDQQGFKKVCEAARWMLGGINVQYFYAVQFDSVVNLVDSIGGVDYDVEIDTTSLNPGYQHLNGDGVLKYLRARTNVLSGGGANDRARVNRQKKMMVAIFDKMKQESLLTSVPAMVSTVNHVYTNISTEQTLALANFASKIDPKSIGQYSLYGPYLNVLQWNFTCVDQENRVSVIKEVYGIEVPEYTDGSYDYGQWLGKYGFSEWKYLATADRVEQYVSPLASESEDIRQTFELFTDAYEDVKDAYAVASVSLDNDDTAVMQQAMAELKRLTVKLASLVDYSDSLDWTVSDNWWTDRDINEINVDFR